MTNAPGSTEFDWECPAHDELLDNDGICPVDGCSRNFVTAIAHAFSTND